MGVAGLVRVGVLGEELFEDVVLRGHVVALGTFTEFKCYLGSSANKSTFLTFKVGKVINQMRLHDLLLEQILLVHEEND